MTWITITGTDWEYDNDAYNNLPSNRQNFWDNQTSISISNGIRTNQNGTELYMRVREIGDSGIPYYESELNKTYLDNS